MAGNGVKRIFLVDDSEDLLDSLELVLEDRIPGSEVDTFLQASDALKKATENPPDLLVTDYFMPDMDGIELAEKLNDARPQLPVMIMSGYLDDRLAARMKKLPNIRGTHAKPLKLADFVASVRKVLAT